MAEEKLILPGFFQVNKFSLVAHVKNVYVIRKREQICEEEMEIIDGIRIDISPNAAEISVEKAFHYRWKWNERERERTEGRELGSIGRVTENVDNLLAVK